jgi:hypothetical protein
VIILGVILIIVGWLLGIWLLYAVGGILLLVGLVLLLVGTVAHHPVGGRAHWY